jgi:DNA-binding LytR/AlgR family response regulator
MRAVIIEDEPLAVDRLQMLVKQVSPETVIEASLESIADAVGWFKEKGLPDFVFMDIHLSDGSAFEIFRKINLDIPVIFTTAFDQYALDAFAVMGIDYLLKPMSADSVDRAMRKMNRLIRSGTGGIDYVQLMSAVRATGQQYKSRFHVKIGNKGFFVEAGEVAYFQADNKIVNLVAIDGCRYIINYTMENLEKMLDPVRFFRASRSCIVQSSAIHQVKPFLNGRLKLSLKVNNQVTEVVVSRERVNIFRSWADQ